MTLHTQIAANSGQTRFDLTFVSTSWRHPWDPTLGITLRKMSAMANTTPIMTTVRKPATNPGREKMPRDADATPKVNIQDFYEEYYEDILSIIMEKILREKRKEVHARLDFGEGSRERRIREGSHYSNAKTLSARQDSSNGDRSQSRDCSRGIRESYDNSYSFYGTNQRYLYRDRDRSHHVKRGRDSKSLLSCVSESGSNDGGHWKSNSRKTRMPNNIKTYDGTGDPEDHIKILHAAAQVERWAIPTWCHMFNSTLIEAARVWFNELPSESINSYKDLKAAFLTYFMQQKMYVKDPVEIHNIKQKDEETIQNFMERFKTMEEMMITTTAFIRGEAVATGKKKGHTSLRTQDQSKRHTSEKRSDFQGQPREGRGSSRFSSFTRTPKEILTAEAGKFQPPPPMSKGRRKETPTKDKPMAIYMIQSWQRMTRQKVTQSFEHVREITFPSLATSSGTEGPLVIEVEIGRHMIHRMYVDGGSSTEVLYEHCFNRLRLEVKNQMVLATTSLTGFSRETIWPLGQLRLLVTIGDADHSTRAWMNFMIPSDMTGVPQSIAEHRLNIREGYSPVRQKKRGQASERAKAIQAEDCYPLLKIDWKVESLCCYSFKFFLDAYKGYHQIQLAESDEEKTAFHTGQMVYCYTKMPFGLTNAGAMYQRPVDKAFDSQIGRDIEVTQYHIPAKDVGERTGPSGFLAEMPNESLPDVSVVETQQEPWTLFTDGSSCVDGSGAAEYEALIAGLRIAAQMGVHNLHHARETTVHGGQSHTVGILLANDAPGCTRCDTRMQRLSNTSSLDKKPSAASNPNYGSMAVLQKQKPWRQSLAIRKSKPELGERNKARLGEGNKNWIEELPYVLWAHRTMIKSIHGDTPFSLTYGTEAVIPTEIGMPTYRTTTVDTVHNNEELQLNLDLLKERRERAVIREAKSKLKMTKYYNANVRGVTFKPGDFVYRSNDASHAVDRGKLTPKWEVPYEVTEHWEMEYTN
nr:reverse transcriptase domain-containing protein [Tanacetum cinerariifolium]